MDPESLSRLARSLDGRPSIGQLAVLNGFLTERELEECLKEQRATGKPLGGLLVTRRHLTPQDLASLLKEQQLLEHGTGRMPDPAEDVERMVGRYALVRQLGAGGAGVVWKAWDTQLERWVALKEPKLDRGVSHERFLREARAAAQLKHPHLIPIFEVGEREGVGYIVMDYVEGQRLDEVRLDPKAAAALMAQVCDAVQAMHAAGVVHRDIKPQNILVDAQGAPHLGDFGLAKMEDSVPITVQGGFLGTPQYAAPEQVAGSATGPAVDVYGLGATLYHLVAGRPPFDNLARHDPRPLEGPPELRLIVRHAMEARPEDRYPTAAALGEDLRRYVRGESLSIRPPTALDLAWKGLRRRAVPVSLALVLLAIGTLWLREASRRDAAYEAARLKGDELWSRALGRPGMGKTLESAIAAYQAATAEAPGKPYPWLMRGRCHRLLGRMSDAEAAWTKALELDPAFGPALLERARLNLSALANPDRPVDPALRQKGERDLQSARAARGLEPAAVSHLEGIHALGAREFEKAVPAFRRYTDENPWDAAALAMQGAAEYYASRFADAEATWTRVIALEPQPQSYRARGLSRHRQGKYADAIADYNLGPADADTICDRGAAEQAAGNLDRAIDDYSKAIPLGRAYNNRGTAYADKRNYEKAHADFVEAQKVAPFYVEPYVNRGVLFMKEGKVAEAVEEFDLALEIEPANVEARLQRATCRLLLLEKEKAIDDLKEALRRAPEKWPGRARAEQLLKEATR